MKQLSLKLLLLAVALSAAGFSCRTKTADSRAQTQSSSQPSPTQQQQPEATTTSRGSSLKTAPEVSTSHYEIVNTYRHDPAAFTQGIIYHEGALLESTGQYGESSLRRVELKSGRVLQKKAVAPQYFAEGIALFQGKIYQLTWTTRKGFIYDAKSFEVAGEFAFDGEGWGLTNDGESLILSDGTNQIRFLDPATFKTKRTISVSDGGRPLRNLNELEYVKGEIYANIWHTDRIVRIDPQTGQILGWIDLAGLLPTAERNDEEAVLNGIAYDEAGDRLFVTGKLWPKLFEIRLKK
ncbi:MAG TPA: glutaminyl-peptide cyclotransferase [Pyrinomonadaceae bacterium]|nr:glutaminyl-peptide cyclotransferase [Pyrinomonadaceae bacterium]